MKISFENCNSIDIGEVEIKENHLNIKYAVNGTGTSLMRQLMSVLRAFHDAAGVIMT